MTDDAAQAIANRLYLVLRLYHKDYPEKQRNALIPLLKAAIQLDDGLQAQDYQHIQAGCRAVSQAVDYLRTL